jgi:hypothetical protein
MPSGQPKELTPGDPAIITTEETARRLAIEVHTVQGFFRDQLLPAVQFSHVWRAYWPAIATHHGIDPSRYHTSPHDPPDGWVTLAEAAERLGITIIVARSSIKRGALPAARVGHYWRVPWHRVIDQLSSPAHMPELTDEHYHTGELDEVHTRLHELADEITGSQLAQAGQHAATLRADAYIDLITRLDRHVSQARAALATAQSRAHHRRLHPPEQ